MKQVKRMIFEFVTNNNLTNEELIKLLFGIARETAHTQVINPIMQLYFSNNIENFTDILYDILLECLTNYYENSEKAYKTTMKYIYSQYFKAQTNGNTTENLDTLEHKEALKPLYSHYNIKVTNYFTVNTKEQIKYIDELIKRTQNNLINSKRVFTSTRQKNQTINKLKALKILENA